VPKGGIDVTDFPQFIRDLPSVDIPIAGVSGHLLQGQTQQVAFLQFEEEAEVPEHSHNAQWELVIAGQVNLRMRGETKTYRVGDSFYIPAGESHGATVRAGYRSIVFFDQADRYKTKT
jgi:quercetin dioxygenase-like cupin family protein